MTAPIPVPPGSPPPVGVKLSIASYAALLGLNILIFLGLFSLAPALPAVQTHFAGAPNAAMLVQIIGAASGFAFALGSLIAGRLITYVGYRPLYIASLITFGVAGAAAMVMPNLYAIIATRVIVGLACAGIVNAALVAVSQLLAPNTQARILGLQSMIASISAIFVYPLIGQLASMDWRPAFAVHLIALLFVPLVMTLPAAPQSKAEAAALPPARGVGVLLLLSTIFVGMTMFIITIFGPLFLAALGITDAHLLSIPPTASAIGGIIGAGLYVVIRPKIGLAGTFALILAAIAIGLALEGLSTTVWLVAAGTLFASMGSAAFLPHINNAAMVASPENPGPTLGLVNAIMFGAMILFPLIATPLTQAAGGNGAIILYYACTAAILAALFMIGGPLRQIPAEPAMNAAVKH